MRRHLHFVGTMPQFADAKAAFTWQLEELGGQLSRLSGGETGSRPLWLACVIDELEQLPQSRTVPAGCGGPIRPGACGATCTASAPTFP